MTRDIEQMVAREAFGAYRSAEQIQTRRPKERVPFVEVVATLQDGTKAKKQLPIQDWPRLHIVNHLPVPRLLSGLPYDPNNLGTLEAQSPSDADYAHVFKKYGWRTFENVTGGFEIGNFARMLAKTAHAYAVAEYGLDGFDPLLVSIIEGRADADSIWSHVGGFEPRAPQQAEVLTRRIEEIAGQSLIVVTISVHAFKAFPAYQVVTGRLTTGPRR